MQVILTHEHADFDALASLLGAHKLYPEALPVLPRTMNRNLRDFLVLYRGKLPFRQADTLPRGKVSRAIFVDSQTAQFVRGMNTETPVLIVDHHACERELPDHYSFEGEPLGATVSLLIERMQASGLALDPVEATLLLLGIYEDTGRLSYASTTPRDMRAAAWLLEQGAELDVVDGFLRHPLTPEQARLYEDLRANVEQHEIAGQPIAIAAARAQAPVEEISTLAQQLIDLLQPAGLFLLVDLGGHVQLVARSGSDRVDVGGVAEALGGGGHPRAAAAVVRGMDLEGARKALWSALGDHIRPPVSVGDIMSRGLHSLPPEMPVAEAEPQMRAHGHEGYPVVEAGELLGLVTRGDIDRAIYHDRHKHPLSAVMRTGQVTVAASDPLRRLRARMVDSGWGQIPVVDDAGKLIGIVTRTDLLTLWADEDNGAEP